VRRFEAVYHPSMNICSVVVDEGERRLIRHELVVKSREEYKRWEYELTEYFADVDSSYLYLPIRYHYRNTESCGSGGLLDIYYEYFPMNLRKEVEIRRESNNRFTEFEICRLLYVLCLVGKNLYSREKSLGNVSMEYILINSEMN
jgi:hypothetical protein